jgi:hypothetical protein
MIWIVPKQIHECIVRSHVIVNYHISNNFVSQGKVVFPRLYLQFTLRVTSN